MPRVNNFLAIIICNIYLTSSANHFILSKQYHGGSMPFMYILECSDKSYYVGSTWSIEKRLSEHQTGEGSNYTKTHLPVQLIYYEEYDRVEDAFHRERQLHGWSRKKKEALIEGKYEKLPELAKKIFRK